MIIKNGLVYCEDETFQNKDLYIQDELITDCSSDDHIIDASNLYVIPGLIDIHFHGCKGYDFCDGTHEAIEAIANYEALNGITTIVPATMTLDDDTLTNIFSTAGTYKNQSGALLMGIHMEGPYLSEAKKGAQNASYLKLPTLEHYHNLNQLSGGLIKIVSIAPEVNGALDMIETLKDEVVVSLAHTTADYSLAMKAFQCGASHVTHLYNAMPPFSHREPGVIGAAFDTPDCKVELICDGIHIAPSVIRATFKLFGAERIILISDSMMATGLSEGEYSLGAQPVIVKGKKATLRDGTIAGSASNLMDCVRNAVQYGIPLEHVIKCATINPAKQIGIDSLVGSLAIGKYANFVLLDKNLNIVFVYVKGKRIQLI